MPRPTRNTTPRSTSAAAPDRKAQSHATRTCCTDATNVAASAGLGPELGPREPLRVEALALERRQAALAEAQREKQEARASRERARLQAIQDAEMEKKLAREQRQAEREAERREVERRELACAATSPGRSDTLTRALAHAKAGRESVRRHARLLGQG